VRLYCSSREIVINPPLPIGRAFIFDGVNNVVVSSLTVRRGSASGYKGSSKLTGGCALMLQSGVTISNVKFDACRSSGNVDNAPAGAIYIDAV